MSSAIPGFFGDVHRWNRPNTTFSVQDGVVIAYCTVAWIICAIALVHSYNATLTHSPFRPLALAILAAATAWAALPPIQLMVGHAQARTLLRTAVHTLSVIVGSGCLAFMSGVWVITHTPDLLTSYLWEVSVPSAGLLLIGLAGIVSSAHNAASPSPIRAT